MWFSGKTKLDEKTTQRGEIKGDLPLVQSKSGGNTTTRKGTKQPARNAARPWGLAHDFLRKGQKQKRSDDSLEKGRQQIRPRIRRRDWNRTPLVGATRANQKSTERRNKRAKQGPPGLKKETQRTGGPRSPKEACLAGVSEGKTEKRRGPPAKDTDSDEKVPVGER